MEWAKAIEDAFWQVVYEGGRVELEFGSEEEAARALEWLKQRYKVDKIERDRAEFWAGYSPYDKCVLVVVVERVGCKLKCV